MITQQRTGCQVQIEFGNKEQMKRFVKWFKGGAFDNLVESDLNPVCGNGIIDGFISCISSDEKMDWGHYFEIG